ncbi:MAG: uncharacterized protein QOG54_1983 [Actinomycetota bacterium]|jgi:ketosteroid isomerase-like protein|nr:uncharacterized protein [Actinomycetota bacterium]
MGDHPNAEIVRRGYEAFAKADFDTLREVFADEITWHVPGRNSFSGSYKGMDEVFGLFAKLAQATDGTFKLELHDVVANDVHAVGLARLTADKDGKHLDSQVANVFHIVDGKATECWGLANDTAAGDEVFG